MGVLGTRRKPFQDSPTPAGNSVAAIALLRLYAFTNQQSYREQAEHTLELPAGLAGKFGIFAATYGIAAVHFSVPHTQVVVIGEDDLAEKLRATAAGFFAFHKTVLKLAASNVVPQNLPPALAETHPAAARAQRGKVGGSGLLRIQLPASGHGARAIAPQLNIALKNSTLNERLNRNIRYLLANKNRADHADSQSVSPQVQKPLARLINSLLLIPLAYRFEQLGLAGLHSGIGPSSALSIGVAIATYVQAKPTIRINILTARFMVFSLRCEAPGRKPHGGGIIQKTDRASSLFSRQQLAVPGELASEWDRSGAVETHRGRWHVYEVHADPLIGSRSCSSIR